MTTLEKLEELLYHGFGETDRKFQELYKETDRKFQETDRKFHERDKETDRKFQETDRKFQETDRKFQETDRKFHERDKETDRKFQETDRKFQERNDEYEKIRLLFQEIAAAQKESARQWDELKHQASGVTDSLGLFAESMVHSGAARLFRERGLEINEVGSRLRSRYNGETMEFDIIASGPSIVLAIEVKLRLRQSHVERFVEKLGAFFKFYPRFRGLTLYGAIGGMSIDADVDRFAYNQGLFVLKLSEDNMQIWNDQNFVPRVFGDSTAKDHK